MTFLLQLFLQMSVRKLQTDANVFYYITFTCFQWISLFRITNLYDYIYKSFDSLKTKKVFVSGYVIMLNHIHVLVFTKNTEEIINNIIGTTKRFMAYEIVKRLKKAERNDLLKLMHDSINPINALKGQVHNVFQTSSDIKRIFTEKFMIQKLNYIHRNPVSGKWRLVDNYTVYKHSSAGFYELGEQGIYKVIHYMDVMNIFSENY